MYPVVLVLEITAQSRFLLNTKCPCRTEIFTHTACISPIGMRNVTMSPDCCVDEQVRGRRSKYENWSTVSKVMCYWPLQTRRQSSSMVKLFTLFSVWTSMESTTKC